MFSVSMIDMPVNMPDMTFSMVCGMYSSVSCVAVVVSMHDMMPMIAALFCILFVFRIDRTFWSDTVMMSVDIRKSVSPCMSFLVSIWSCM